MTRSEIIAELKKYFDIRELVCPHTYKAFGDKAWQFLDTEILETILIVRRDIIKKPMTCNDYHIGGGITQRGLRCNICKLVQDKSVKNQIYLSAHCNGAGFDFVVTGMSSDAVRKSIEANSNLLPHQVRMENAVSWLHIDCYDNGSGKKVSYFNG